MEESEEKIEIFEIDDDFDPLEETGLELSEEADQYAGGIEYQVPVIPDADKSIVPDPVILPPEERIAKLIKGLPGQKFRILSGIKVCAEEPKTLEQASEELETLYPQGTSVYTAARIIELLTDAGALDRIDPEPAEEATADTAEQETINEAPVPEPADEDERVESISWDDVDAEFEEVEQVEPSTYVATAAGLAAVEENWSANAAVKVVEEEPQYRSIYKKVLDMCAEPGGKTKVEIAQEIDSDPLIQEPRRWCQYFLEKLREVNALEWDENWYLTEIGRGLLESDLFTEEIAAE